MRTHIIRRLSLLLGSAIGATNCHEYEYGIPSGSFTISGSVADAATGQGIPDIRIEADGGETSSAQDGSWLIETHPGSVRAGQASSLMATDVDGRANGSYEPTHVEFHPVELREGDDRYDQGDWEATDVLVEMESFYRDTGP